MPVRARRTKPASCLERIDGQKTVNSNACRLHALLRHAELHPPAEQHAGHDPVLERQRHADARLVTLQGDGALLLVLKMRRAGCFGGGGSLFWAAVKRFSDAASLALDLTTGRAEGCRWARKSISSSLSSSQSRHLRRLVGERINAAARASDRTCTSKVRADDNISSGPDRSDAMPQCEPATRLAAPCSRNVSNSSEILHARRNPTCCDFAFSGLGAETGRLHNRPRLRPVIGRSLLHRPSRRRFARRLLRNLLSNNAGGV